MEEAKSKCPKLNQLSKTGQNFKRINDSGDTKASFINNNLLKTTIKDAQYGLRSSKNQISPKIYTNNMISNSNIPRLSSIEKKSNNKKYLNDNEENDDDTSEFRTFLAKRSSNTSLTRHVSLLVQPTKSNSSLSKLKGANSGILKNNIISVPAPQLDCNSLAFNYCDSASLRQREQLKEKKEKDEEKPIGLMASSGFKIYSNSQNNLKLSDSNDNSFVELEDYNESRLVRSPVSRKLSQKSTMSSSSASSNEQKESNSLNKKSSSSITKSKSCSSSLNSKKASSPTSLSSSKIDLSNNKQGIAYINIENLSSLNNLSIENLNKFNSNEELITNQITETISDNQKQNISESMKLINQDAEDEKFQETQDEFLPSKTLPDTPSKLSSSNLSESLSLMKVSNKNETSSSITKLSDLNANSSDLTSIDSKLTEKNIVNEEPSHDFNVSNDAFNGLMTRKSPNEKKLGNEKINRKNSLLVKKLIINHYPEALSLSNANSNANIPSNVTSNLKRNASMPAKPFTPKVSYGNIYGEKSSSFQMQENFDVKYKIKQFEKIKADSLSCFNNNTNSFCNSTSSINPVSSKISTDYYKISSSRIDERAPKLLPNDFYPSIKFKELKSIFECSNQNVH